MRILATAAAMALLASQASAGTYETRCETVSTPYQATVNGAKPEQVIGGAIVGGLIGKAATKKNAGALAGAVIGGAVANQSGTQTVTRYKDVETCANVFIPERITDQAQLQQVLLDLNAGKSVSKEMTMDVQYTIGVGYDGKWGPKSKGAAEEYLANLQAGDQSEEPLYSLVVNDVVIVSSADVTAIDQMKQSLFEAGVDSQIFVDLQQ